MMAMPNINLNKDLIMKIKMYFLILAFVVVSIIALLYGVSSHWFARTFLGVVELRFKHCPYSQGCKVSLSRAWTVLAILSF